MYPFKIGRAHDGSTTSRNRDTRGSRDSVDPTARTANRPVDNVQRQQSESRGQTWSKEAPPQRKQAPAPPRKSPHQVPPGYSKSDYIDLLSTEQETQLHQIHALRQKIADLDKEKLVMEKQHADQQLAQKQTYEAEIQQLQQQAFQNIKESRFQPYDDTTVTNKISGIQSSIMAFAKTYALDSLNSLQSQPDETLAELRKALNDGGIASVSSIDSLLELITMPHSARLCLTGLLSSAIHSLAFGNPFFLMSDGLQDRFDAIPDGPLHDLRDRIDPADAFCRNFELIRDVDQQQAHLWRSDTLRALTPDLDRQDNGEAASRLRNLLQHELAAQCKRAANSFELGAARFVTQPLEAPLRDAFRNNLRALFEEAGGLARRLWTQRTGIECRFNQGLEHERFAVDSFIMQAHALHKLDDPDDHSLDGRAVKLVLHPAVLRLGTHDGENYHESRVWAKAVVWLNP